MQVLLRQGGGCFGFEMRSNLIDVSRVTGHQQMSVIRQNRQCMHDVIVFGQSLGKALRNCDGLLCRKPPPINVNERETDFAAPAK